MATKHWLPTSGNNANLDANWQEGTKPATGDSVVFDTTSLSNCNWDMGIVSDIIFTVANGYSGTITISNQLDCYRFIMSSGNTATITQSALVQIFGWVTLEAGAWNEGANITCVGDFAMSGGTFTGNTSYTLTCAGDFTYSGGTLTPNVLRLIMTGTGKTVGGTSTSTVDRFTVNSGASITIAQNFNSVTAFSNEGSISISTGKTLQFSTWGTPYSYANTGTIDGLGTFKFFFYDTDRAITIGTINCPVRIDVHASATGNRTFTLGANSVFGSTLTIVSSHATYTAILATSTYTLSCTTLTLDTRGCLTQSGTAGNVTCTSFVQSGAGSVLTGKVDATFTCSGNFTKTNGTLTAFVLVLKMTGTTKTISSNDEADFHSLWITGTVTTSTSVVLCRIFVNDGTLTIGAQGFYWYTDSVARTFTNNATINGAGVLNINIQAADMTPTFGTINCPVVIATHSGAVANRTVTLGANTVFGSTVTINSLHAANTMTLNTAGFTLNCTTLTLDTRGSLTQGTGTITCTTLALNANAGTFTQGGTVSVGTITMAGGTLTGSTSYTITCSGNFTKTAGTITGSTVCLIMSGTDVSLNVNGGNALANLQVTGSTTILTGFITLNSGTSIITGILTLSGAATTIYDYTVTTQVSGILKGNGIYRITDVTGNIALNYGGRIYCPFYIYISSISASKTVTMARNLTFDNYLTVVSDHAANTVTLNTAGYTLNCTSLTIGIRGILDATTSTIKVCGTIDTSAGTLTEGTSTFILCGASGNIKLGAHKFYNLIVKGVYTLTANARVTNYYGYWRAIIPGAFTLTIDDATKTYDQWRIYPRVNWIKDPIVKMDSQYLDRLIGQ